MSGDEISEWVFESLLQFFRSPLWTTPTQNFVEDNCHIFDAAEAENKLEYTAVHVKFRSLVEGLVTGFLTNLGVTTEAFMAARASGRNAELSEMVTEFIVALDDFRSFRSLMEKKNLELELEAMYEHAKYTSGLEEGGDEEGDDMDDDERFLLEMAIHLSLGEHDVALKRLEKEDKDALHELTLRIAQEQERLLAAQLREADEERREELAAAAQRQVAAMTAEVEAQRIAKLSAALGQPQPQPQLGDVSERRSCTFGARAALPGIPQGTGAAPAPLDPPPLPSFAQLHQQLKATAGAPSAAAPGAAEPSAEELARRAAYFRAQRDALRDERRRGRDEALAALQSAHGAAAPATSGDASASVPGAVTCDKENAERAMRKAIAQRFKEDLLQEARRNNGSVA